MRTKKFKFDSQEKKTHEGLPLFEMVIDEEEGAEGMNFISLVKEPATERPFFRFNLNKKKKRVQKEKDFQFGISDEEKQLVTGVVMLAETPIFRDMNGEKFYIVFRKAQVEEMSFKYMKDQFGKRVNLDHDENRQVEGVYLVESYLFDKDRGSKVPEFIGDVPDGSWIATFKIENEEVWKKVKAGEFEGFSLEGDFGLQVAFGKNDLSNSLKNSILDENLSSREKYNALTKAIRNVK